MLHLPLIRASPICIEESLRISLQNFRHEDLGCVRCRARERVAFVCAGTDAAVGASAFTDGSRDARQSGSGYDPAFSIVDLFRRARGRLLSDDSTGRRGFERVHGDRGCAPA